VHPDVAPAIDYATKGWDADLGVVRMGVRDYDPLLSRFLQPDPLFLENLGKSVDSPVEANLYGYARNSPTTTVDPEGQEAIPLAVPWGIAAGDGAVGTGFGVELGLGPAGWIAAGVTILAAVSWAVLQQDAAKAEPRVRFCQDTVAQQQGHHTIPQALMREMTAQGMMSPATLSLLLPTNRDAMLRVDRDTHQQIHEGLTRFLVKLHPELPEVKGFPSQAWWNGYLQSVEGAVGAANPAAAKAQVMSEIGSYYMGVKPIQGEDSCGHETMQVPIFKFAQDAAVILASPPAASPNVDLK
jgi:RHS repeat-associated protein